MEKLNQNIEKHYLKEELYEDIVNRLKEQDIDLKLKKTFKNRYFRLMRN